MLYRIHKAVAHPDHTVTVTWSDGVEVVVDLSPVIAKGNVFAPLQDGHYFAANMRVTDDRLGIEWPNRVDFSADGLRFRAFPEEEKVEFEGRLPRRTRGEPCRPISPTRRAENSHATFGFCNRQILWCGAYQWRCTDIGTRVITAIKLDHDDDPSWYNGPPYALAESVFDEYDMEGCSLVRFADGTNVTTAPPLAG